LRKDDFEKGQMERNHDKNPFSLSSPAGLGAAAGMNIKYYYLV